MKALKISFLLLIILSLFVGCSNSEPKIMTAEETIQSINNGTINKYKGYETELRGYVSNTIGKYNNAKLGFELSFDERSGISRKVLIDIEDIGESINTSEYQINTPVKVIATAHKQNDFSIFKTNSLEIIASTEVVNPTTDEIVINVTEEYYGDSITVEKIQFADKETRLFIKVKNEKDEAFSLDGVTAIQNNTNYTEWKTYDGIYDIRLAEGTEKQVVYYTQNKLSKENLQLKFNITSDKFLDIPSTAISKYEMNLMFDNEKLVPYVQKSKELGKNFTMDSYYYDDYENCYVTKEGDNSFVVYMPDGLNRFLGTYDIDIVLADKEYWYNGFPTYVYLDTIKIIEEFDY